MKNNDDPKPKMLPPVVITAKRLSRQDSVNLTPKGKVSLKQVDSLMKFPSVARAIGVPYRNKFSAQQSDNIKKLLKKP